jgi:hypothetical protein
MDWRALDMAAENRFKIEFERAKKWVRERYHNLPPHKQSEIARKIAKREVDRFLEREYGVNWDYVRGKIAAQEIDISLEDLAI